MDVKIRLTDTPFLSKCLEDSSYKVMIFSAAEGSGLQDIAFPHQSELKINGGDFKANLRGLKNKPGSTKPVDITTALRLKASYTNSIEFTYALTHKVIPHVAGSLSLHSVVKADDVTEIPCCYLHVPRQKPN